MSAFKIITSLQDFTSKTVLVRIDTDVEVKKEKVLDDTRLKASLDTINYLLRKGATVILLGHLGRPAKQYQMPNAKFQISNEDTEYSLEPVARWFGLYYQRTIRETKAGEFPAWQIAPKLMLLENLRFFEAEEGNDHAFAKVLASLGNLYVDDAFAVAHRAHASIVGIPKLLPSYAGIHFAKEIETLGKIIEHPKRPLTILIGGAKIETKLPLVERMHAIADFVLVGGEIAEQDKVLIHVQHEKVHGQKSAVLVADLTDDKLDITPKDVESFIQILNLAKTIVWNGPVGLTGKGAQSEKGTKAIAEAIAASSSYKVVGGGDTLAFLKTLDLMDKFDFVSTGGGAMLELLSGKKLPGIVALET